MKLKTELYSIEQDCLVNKLIKILNLDELNSITLYELDNDPDKQQNIMNLKPEIKKYYNCKYISGVKDNEKTIRPWLSIIRHLTRNNYDMLIADYRLLVDDKKIRTKRYIFLNKSS